MGRCQIVRSVAMMQTRHPRHRSSYSGSIQYAAAYRFHHWRLWNTGSPPSRGRRLRVWLAVIASQRVGANVDESSLPGLTRQSIFFEKTSCEDGWMPGSSPGMTSVFCVHTNLDFKQQPPCKYSFAISPHVLREVWPARSALCNQRAQGMPGARCARRRACRGSGRKHTR
jgi:hypothetical protein